VGLNKKGVKQMKTLKINNEWRVVVDANGNYMPERYVIREGGKIVQGKETKAFEGWERQGSYLANEIQAVTWIATKVNHESGPQDILESLQDIITSINTLMDQMAKVNAST
jgi:hypothetical protein